jgi:hypothetical protein
MSLCCSGLACQHFGGISSLHHQGKETDGQSGPTLDPAVKNKRSFFRPMVNYRLEDQDRGKGFFF